MFFEQVLIKTTTEEKNCVSIPCEWTCHVILYTVFVSRDTPNPDVAKPNQTKLVLV